MPEQTRTRTHWRRQAFLRRQKQGHTGQDRHVCTNKNKDTLDKIGKTGPTRTRHNGKDRQVSIDKNKDTLDKTGMSERTKLGYTWKDTVQ